MQKFFITLDQLNIILSQLGKIEAEKVLNSINTLLLISQSQKIEEQKEEQKLEEI